MTGGGYQTSVLGEFLLDQILTELWKGKLLRKVAVGRIMAKLSRGRRAVQDEVDGFLPSCGIDPVTR
jgi:hypothetical protein